MFGIDYVLPKLDLLAVHEFVSLRFVSCHLLFLGLTDQPIIRYPDSPREGT